MKNRGLFQFFPVMLLMLVALPLMAETVKVNIQLNGKTRFPNTNLWMGVLEVHIAGKVTHYTVSALSGNATNIRNRTGKN